MELVSNCRRLNKCEYFIISFFFLLLPFCYFFSFLYKSEDLIGQIIYIISLVFSFLFSFLTLSIFFICYDAEKRKKMIRFFLFVLIELCSVTFPIINQEIVFKFMWFTKYENLFLLFKCYLFPLLSFIPVYISFTTYNNFCICNNLQPILGKQTKIHLFLLFCFLVSLPLFYIITVFNLPPFSYYDIRAIIIQNIARIHFLAMTIITLFITTIKKRRLLIIGLILFSLDVFIYVFSILHQNYLFMETKDLTLSYIFYFVSLLILVPYLYILIFPLNYFNKIFKILNFKRQCNTFNENI